MSRPFYQLLPDLTPEEYEALKASIASHGILVPIEVDEQGNVLDGHHRLKAAKELGLPDEAIPKKLRSGLSEEEKLEFVLRVNLVRRHLTREQKHALAVQLRQQGWIQERIAAVLGVSQQTVSNWLRDVTKIGNVDAESGKPALPATITDTLGRRQPARKPRRQSSAVVKRPVADEATAASAPPPLAKSVPWGRCPLVVRCRNRQPPPRHPRRPLPSPCFLALFRVCARPGSSPKPGGGAADATCPSNPHRSARRLGVRAAVPAGAAARAGAAGGRRLRPGGGAGSCAGRAGSPRPPG